MRMVIFYIFEVLCFELYFNEFFFFCKDHYHHQSNELQAHLQHLQHFQGIQHNRNLLRSEQSEIITPLSEQGYETASNNGRYSGPSSYDVHLQG